MAKHVIRVNVDPVERRRITLLAAEANKSISDLIRTQMNALYFHKAGAGDLALLSEDAVNLGKSK